METCSVETGLLKKKACGAAAVARCENCEQPLCSKHALPQRAGAGRKPGKFLCAPCDTAHRAHEKLHGALPEARPATAKPTAAPAAAPPAKPAPAPAKKEEPSDGAIDFTPGGDAPKT